MTPNEAWKTLSTTCKETTKDLLCVKEPNNKNEQHRRKYIFTAKEIKDEIETTNTKGRRKQLERNRKSTEYQTVPMMDQQLKAIEKYKEDSNKHYQAICKINSRKPKKPPKIYGDNFNLITREKGQVTIASKFFQKLFSSCETPMAIWSSV